MIQNDSQNSNLNLIKSAQLGKTNQNISFCVVKDAKNGESCEAM